MELFYLSIAVQVILFIYFEVITLVELYPWNDLKKYSLKEKIIEAGSNGLFLILCIGLFSTKIKGLMLVSVVGLFIFFAMQLLVWWLPYLTGIHLKQFPKRLYETHFTHTYKMLPPIKDHIVPDAQHNVLQLLSLFAFLVSMTTLLTY